MKKMLDEFKGFIQQGDIVTIAVGLIMALYFQKIVEALLDGVINPIIAAISESPTSRRSVSTSVRRGSASDSSSTLRSASCSSRSFCSCC